MLQRAIESALSQGVPAYEHIIIDGKSSDGTIEMLQQYPHLHVVSEQDANLYDAWNKGIRLAEGNVICILNSDDELPEGAFEEVTQMALREPHSDIFSGAIELVRTVDGEESIALIDDAAMIGLREQDVGPGIPLTNGRFISRRLFDQIGVFDVRYPALSDRQFYLRAIIAKAKNTTTAAVLYRYHIHSSSLTLNDKLPSLLFAREARQAAMDGMQEGHNNKVWLAFARWHAWASFYLIVLYLRRRDGRAAWQTLKQAFSADVMWWFRLPPLCVRHFLERRARFGISRKNRANQRQ
jgi:glycosyltransferase involved in cell wall biosynthesis